MESELLFSLQRGAAYYAHYTRRPERKQSSAHRAHRETAADFAACTFIFTSPRGLLLNPLRACLTPSWSAWEAELFCRGADRGIHVARVTTKSFEVRVVVRGECYRYGVFDSKFWQRE